MLTLYNDFIVKTSNTKSDLPAKQNRFQDITLNVFPNISQI